MSTGIQKIAAMPLCPAVGLVNRQIKDGFANTLSVGMQPASDKSPTCQNDSPGVNDVFDIVSADMGFKMPTCRLPDM